MNDRTPSSLRGLPLALLLAIPAAPAAVRAEPAALTVSIAEGVDAAAVRARLAAELKAKIHARPDGGACELPCLSITLDAGSATVAFTPLRGAPRARTVELGADPAQWAIVIALLAGNVVRDEASEVLALLPEPAQPPGARVAPAAPPEAALPPGLESPAAHVSAACAAPVSAAPVSAAPAVAAPAEPERPSRLLGFGFVPGLSTDLTRVGQVTHFLSLDLIAGVSGGSTGVTVSGVADVERGRVSGVQAAGVTALAWRVAGFQVAGVAAVSGELDGVQVGGVAAVAGASEGAQIGGVAALARGRADVQIGGVAAVARGHAGTQVAGVAAVADGANVQASGVASVAHGTANIQIAGVVNVARRARGLQLAPVNVARRVDGVQIGVVNVGSAEGFSFGLINIVPGGRADLEATVDSSRLGTLLFRHGGRRWHNVYGIGGHPVDEDGLGTGSSGGAEDVWMYGLGFGPSWRAGGTVFDLELIGWQINHGTSHYDGLSLLGQLRLSMAYGVGPLQLVAGGALNAHVSSDPQSPLVLERRTMDPEMTREVRVVTWPSAFVGVRI